MRFDLELSPMSAKMWGFFHCITSANFLLSEALSFCSIFFPRWQLERHKDNFTEEKVPKLLTF